jgi:hypothetical protein
MPEPLTGADLAMMRATLESAAGILRDPRQTAGNRRRATQRLLECAFGLLQLLEVALREREERADQLLVP